MSNQKIALVTGGSRGLGKNTALTLAAQGVDVIFTYHSNQTAAEEVKTAIAEMGQKAEYLQLDTGIVSSFGDFKAGLEQVLQVTWHC